MTKQIMKLMIPYNASWKIVMDDSEQFNKFKVYRISGGHTRMLQKYGDIASCLHYITQQTTGYVWQKTDIKVARDY